MRINGCTRFLLAVAAIAMQGASPPDPELTPFGRILLAKKPSLADEVRAAGLLADYLSVANGRVPDPTAGDLVWANAQISSGSFEQALRRPEGCFALYKKINARLREKVTAIAAFDPKKLSLLQDKAPEDTLWIMLAADLSNPLTMDVLDCPSRYINNVRLFNPISDANVGAGTANISNIMITSSVLNNFVLNDSRFLAQQVLVGGRKN